VRRLNALTSDRGISYANKVLKTIGLLDEISNERIRRALLSSTISVEKEKDQVRCYLHREMAGALWRALFF
jgi:hypothetical protein